MTAEWCARSRATLASSVSTAQKSTEWFQRCVTRRVSLEKHGVHATLRQVSRKYFPNVGVGFSVRSLQLLFSSPYDAKPHGRVAGSSRDVAHL